MLIYFAAPLFCQAEREFNLQLAERIEAQGFSVFLPQRDGIESSQPANNQMSEAEQRQTIFDTDRDKVLEADILLFVLDGRVPDEGACVELGIAYAQKKLLKTEKWLVGYHTDCRSAFPGAKLNTMIQGCFNTLTENEDDLMAALESYRNTRELLK